MVLMSNLVVNPMVAIKKDYRSNKKNIYIYIFGVEHLIKFNKIIIT
jgi:hypothetical protein